MDTTSIPFGQGLLRWTTRSGVPLTIRHIAAEDEALLIELYGRLSERTRWLRFAMVLNSLPMSRIREGAHRLAAINPIDADALVALHNEDGAERIVAVARLAGATAESAEFALLVRDDFQGQGIGAYIFDLIVQVALVRGLSELRAYVLAENTAMLALIRNLGFPYSLTISQGEAEVAIHLRESLALAASDLDAA